MSALGPGPLNGLADVAGLSIGHAEAADRATGATVILCDRLTPASVDVRGGGPATRETDLLRPGASVGAAHAIVLSGGSVFGLAAAEAVAAELSARGVGLTPTPGAPHVPIVPAACLYDLPMAAPQGWAGAAPPYHALGAAALEAAWGVRGEAVEPRLGPVGAGRGARAGAWPGGLGEASLALEGGLTVAALAAANPVGSPYMADGRTFWAWPLERRWRGAPEFGGARPDPEKVEPADPFPGDAKFSPSTTGAGPHLNTVIAAVAVDADLQSAELLRLAMMAQSGLARAVRPAHTGFDGDTVFALATGAVAVPSERRLATLSLLGAAAADCLARAVARGVHAARESLAAAGP